jgi:hypothetical protein
MTRIAFSSVQKSPEGALRAESQVQAIGGVHTRPVFSENDRPVWFYQHDLEGGAELLWDGPDHRHCVYLEEGSAEFEGTSVGVGDAVFIEHRARARLKAGSGGAKIAHFHSSAAQPAPERAGGHTHVVGFNAERKPIPANKNPETVRYLLADCETCGLWLHQTGRQEFVHVPVHSHSANEIIYLLRGQIHVGSQTLTPGAAIAVNGDTRYTFKSGDDGLRYINFRPSPSWQTKYDDKGRPGEAIPESQF